jgi:hypothetical protein
MKNKKFKLNIEDNYNSDMIYEKNDVIIQYLLVIQHYIDHCITNTNNKNNSIFFTGLQMTTNVFRIMLYYTKNLELTMYHTRNGIYYYVEYISQITDTDDNIFFNLTVKDAIMYVYTRTLFDINKSYVKNDNTKAQDLDFLNNYLHFMNLISNVILNVNLDSFKNKLNLLINTLKELINKDKSLILIEKNIDNTINYIKNSKDIKLDNIIDSINVTTDK